MCLPPSCGFQCNAKPPYPPARGFLPWLGEAGGKLTFCKTYYGGQNTWYYAVCAQGAEWLPLPGDATWSPGSEGSGAGVGSWRCGGPR